MCPLSPVHLRARILSALFNGNGLDTYSRKYLSSFYCWHSRLVGFTLTVKLTLESPVGNFTILINPTLLLVLGVPYFPYSSSTTDIIGLLEAFVSLEGLGDLWPIGSASYGDLAWSVLGVLCSSG